MKPYCAPGSVFRSLAAYTFWVSSACHTILRWSISACRACCWPVCFSALRSTSALPCGDVTPQGFVGANVVAFLPLDTRIQPGEKEWYSDYELAYKDAAEHGKLIFIDFTGQNCPNCRYNEKNVFPLPDVQQELKKYVRSAIVHRFGSRSFTVRIGGGNTGGPEQRLAREHIQRFE